MKNNKKGKCDNCGHIYNWRGLVLIKGKRLCSKCRKKKATLMPQISQEIPKSYLPPKLKVRERKVKVRIVKDVEPPKMRGAKKLVSKKVTLYLTSDERRFLWTKFVKSGMTQEESNNKVAFIVGKMNELAKSIRAEAQRKPLTDIEMNMKFLEGLSKYSEEVLA